MEKDSVSIIEPRIDVRASVESDNIIIKGALKNTPKTNIASSWGSPASTPLTASWSITPPNNTIIDRFIKMRVYVQVEADADFQFGTNDALRQFPLNSIIENLQVTVNSSSLSDRVGDKLHALLCYTARDDWNKSASLTAVSPDNYQEYKDWATYGSSKNPLADYGEASAYDPRGGFPRVDVSPTVARFVLTEPLLLSPFYDGSGYQEEGMANVNTLNINVTWKSQLSLIMSHSTLGNAITTLTVTFYQAPEMLLNFLTPDLSQEIPAQQVLPYSQYSEYIKTDTPAGLAPDASEQVVSDTVILSQIPRYLYVFARHSKTTSTFETSNSFLSIEQLNIDFANDSSILNTATAQELYEISRRNGLNLSWPQFSKYRGSVVCLEFGKDIGLQDNLAPGVAGSFNLQVTATFKNTSASAFTADFYIVILNQGTLTLVPNASAVSLGNITQQEVLDSVPHSLLSHEDHHRLEGGSSFFSKLKNVVHKVARGVRKGSHAISKISPALIALYPELAPFAPLVGQLEKGAEFVERGTRKKRQQEKPAEGRMLARYGKPQISRGRMMARDEDLPMYRDEEEQPGAQYELVDEGQIEGGARLVGGAYSGGRAVGGRLPARAIVRRRHRRK